jgi:hypothetical protein
MPTTTLIYDSDCGFCRWLLAKVLAWDRRGTLLIAIAVLIRPGGIRGPC